MAATVLEVKDIARLLVVPSRKKAVSPSDMAAFNARLAPIEMNAPTVHLVPGMQKHSPAFGPSSRMSDPSPSGVDPVPTRREAIELPQWVLPSVYAGCGLVLSVCTLLVPGAFVPCMHALAPIWTGALLLHALADGDVAWLWLGCLTAALLPLVLLIAEPLFGCFYLIVFGAFASGRFWRSLHGPALILVAVCLFGLVVSCVLSVLADHSQAHLSVAVLFALGAAIASSMARFGKLRLSVA